MSEITAKHVQELRAATGAGVMDAKKALTDTGGDVAKATALINERGLAKAAKKSQREASEGLVHAYIHGGGKIGVMLEVNCETDFVARNEEFRTLVNDLALQIAASDPEVVSDPASLAAQPFIKDPDVTIEDYIKRLIAKLGENIVVARFTRYELGQS